MNERKKLLFVVYGLGIGGIEKCLVNLLNVLPEEKFDIDVLLMNPERNSIPQIRRKVSYLDSYQYVMSIEGTPGEMRERGGALKNLPKVLAYCDFRLRIKARENAWPVFRSLPGWYDIAVAYSQNDYSPYYVIDKVQAKRKVLWYHNGAYEGTGRAYERDRIYYPKFDYIVAVSEDCRRVLESKFHFADRQLITLRNICDAEAIRKQALAFVPDSFSAAAYHIVTVGRMTGEKGADLALECCERLREHGRKVAWHWVGDGNMKQALQSRIAEKDLREVLILEGNQVNPYPFMKQADLYVQPSYYEAYSTTVTEAKILQKPMVVTDVGGMREQLEDSVNGLIVPIDAAKITDAIIGLMDSPELAEQFKAKLAEERFDPERYLEEYYQTVFSEG